MLLEELASASPGNQRYAVLRRFEKDESAVEMLRAVRRDGPGRLRRAALDALAAVGGETALEPADQRLVERFVRVRRLTDPIGG